MNAVAEQLRVQLQAAQSDREAAEELAAQAQQQQQAAQAQVAWERTEREKMQRKLAQAEASLERLDKALRDAGVKVTIDFEVGCDGRVLGQLPGKRFLRQSCSFDVATLIAYCIT